MGQLRSTVRIFECWSKKVMRQKCSVIPGRENELRDSLYFIAEIIVDTTWMKKRIRTSIVASWVKFGGPGERDSSMKDLHYFLRDRFFDGFQNCLHNNYSNHIILVTEKFRHNIKGYITKFVVFVLFFTQHLRQLNLPYKFHNFDVGIFSKYCYTKSRHRYLRTFLDFLTGQDRLNLCSNIFQFSIRSTKL